MRNELRSWALTWSLVGVAGWALLPWYAIADGIFSPGWPARILADRDLAPAALQAILFGRAWLMGPGLALLAGLIVVLRGGPRALVGLFTFYPIARILTSAALAADGAPSARAFAERLFAAKIWRLDCLRGGGCGVGWNTLALALLTAVSTTALGLAFALVVTRTG